MRILALHVHRLGKLRSEIRVRSELSEEGFGQGLGVGSSLWIGNNDLGIAAFGIRPRERDGLLGGETKSNEEGRIVDIYRHRLAVRIDRLLQRQGEVER